MKGGKRNPVLCCAFISQCPQGPNLAHKDPSLSIHPLVSSLFSQLPGMFIGHKKPVSCLGPALKAGLEALRVRGGGFVVGVVSTKHPWSYAHMYVHVHVHITPHFPSLPQSGGCNGKLVVFHCGLPSASGPGQLKDRMDQKLIGTDKEKVWSGGAGDVADGGGLVG